MASRRLMLAAAVLGALLGCVDLEPAPGQEEPPVTPAPPPPAPAGAPGAPVPAPPGAAVPKEVRAVWYNFYKLPAQRAAAEPLVTAHVKVLRDMGVNRVYALVKTPDGFVHYASKVYAQRPGQDWDPFGHLLRLGTENGIDIRPYVNVFCEGGEEPADAARNPLLSKNPQWAAVTLKGKRLGWASPACAGVVEYQLGLLKDLARQYDVKGLQLDRIRFPSGSEAGGDAADYNPEALRRYREKYRKPAGAMPADNDPDWIRFRQDLVTDFVRAARREVKAIRPGAAISAAVFPDPASAARRQLQDWGAWCREGLLDEVCTMSYDARAEPWEKLLTSEAQAAGRVPLVAGIGALKMSRADQLAGHIDIARRRGTAGYILFNAYSVFDNAGLVSALAEANR